MGKNADLFAGALEVGAFGYPDDTPSLDYCGVYTMVSPDDAEPGLNDPDGGWCDHCGKPYCKMHEGGEPNACIECVAR